MIKNEDLHTPWRVRIIVGLIGVALLLSTMAIYLTVFVQYGSQKLNVATATAGELEDRYSDLAPVVAAYADSWSVQYFETMRGDRSEVKGFNEEALEYGARDLKVGDGQMIDSASDPYLAYYIGWKSDEEILDSSFDSYSEPTGLKTPLLGTTQMIRGWLEGIVGMRIGGVREISIPADYAYGSDALKFIVMLIPYDEQEITDIVELNDIQTELMNRQYASSQIVE